MNKTKKIITTTILLAIFVGFLMSMVNMSANVISPVISGVFVLYPLIANIQEDKDKTRLEKIDSIVENEGHISPLLAAFMFFCQIIFLERLFSGLIGGIAGATLGLNGVSVEEKMNQAIFIGAIFTNFILFFALIPISKAFCYKVSSYPLHWLIGTLLASKIFSGIITFISIESGLIPMEGGLMDRIFAISIDIIVFSLFHSLSIYIGFFWSRFFRKRNILNRIFKQLTLSEQETLIELARDIPHKTSQKT